MGWSNPQGSGFVKLADSTGAAITSSNPSQVSLATTLSFEDQTNNRGNMVLVDATGNVNKAGVNAATQVLVNTEGQKSTYGAAVFGFAPPASSTDVWTILGSATKTVRVTRIWVAARATAATAQRIKVLKYSTAYTGGTPTAATIVPLDSSNAAATAVVNDWHSGLPTVGSLVGALYDSLQVWNILALTTTQPFVDPPTMLLDFTIRNAQGIVLRNNTQYISLNLNTASPPSGGVLDVAVEWTEE